MTKSLPWWLRDLLWLALFVAVLVGLAYGLEAIPIAGIAYYNRILVIMGINITLAVSLNIINGHAGQFSLGHAGFMAVGAYFSAYLTYYHFAPRLDKMPAGTQQWLMQNVFLVIAVLCGGLLAAVAGYLVGLPSLRLRGDYLAIVTLGFGEIIRVLILNIDKIGAARGFSGIPHWSNFFWVFLVCGLTMVVSWRLVQSSVGRAFLAVREDQIAAEAMGVDTTRYKVKAFVIGSFFAGVAGGLYAHYMMYLNPQMFMFVKSFEVVAMVVLGGLGSISGSVVAAVILTFLPEGLRSVKDYMPGGRDPRMVIYSIMLIVLMLTRPQGLFGRRELWQIFGRRKDAIPDEKRDEGDAGDEMKEKPVPVVAGGGASGWGIGPWLALALVLVLGGLGVYFVFGHRPAAPGPETRPVVAAASSSQPVSAAKNEAVTTSTSSTASTSTGASEAPRDQSAPGSSSTPTQPTDTAAITSAGVSEGTQASDKARGEPVASANDTQHAAVPSDPSKALLTVHFQRGSFDIDQNDRQLLRELVMESNQNNRTAVVIEGYACSLGSAATNKQLGARRARAVEAFLTELGLKARPHIVSFGSRFPVADNTTEEGRIRNRRVVVSAADL